MPYDILFPTGNVLISSDTRSGLSEEIDKFVMEHDPDTMNIRSTKRGSIDTVRQSGGYGPSTIGSEFPVPDIPLYKNKKWSVLYKYTENAEKIKKDKLEAKRLEKAKIAEKNALIKDKMDAKFKVREEIAKLEKQLAKLKKK